MAVMENIFSVIGKEELGGLEMLADVSDQGRVPLMRDNVTGY